VICTGRPEPGNRHAHVRRRSIGRPGLHEDIDLVVGVGGSPGPSFQDATTIARPRAPQSSRRIQPLDRPHSSRRRGSFSSEGSITGSIPTAQSTFSQMDLSRKPAISGDLAEPSDGLEPSTPSLPCGLEPLPWVVGGRGLAYLSRFRGHRLCYRLPPVAPAWLHRCSISRGPDPLVGRGVPARFCFAV
jgi:hypothetical protein